MAKLLPSSNSAIVKYQKSAIAKSGKFLGAKTTKVGSSIKQNSNFLLLDIEKKVIQIDKLLKDSLLLSKKESEIRRMSSERKEFEGKEKELERKKEPLIKGIKLPSPPKMGFLDWIKNFITQTILGFFAVRLINFLPQLLKILPVIIKVGDFFTDVGGKMLDGLITFVDWGYKAIDGTRQFTKQLGGEGLAQNFDKFAGAIDNIIEIAIITALATADSGGSGGSPDVAPKGPAGKPSRGPISQLGRKAFVGTLGKGGAKTVLKFIRPFTKRLPIIGGLLDFGLSVALGEKIGRAAFRAIGATLLGAIGAAVGGPFALLTGLAGGTLGDIAGGALYDLFFENKKPQGKTVKAAGGGKPATRGGKPVSGPAKRTLKKKKAPRTLRATPSKLRPGGVVGGEKKIKELYPESKDKSKMSPFDFLKKSYDTFAKSSGLGALVALAIKPIVGDKPTYADYKNAGTGVNNWMNQSIASGTLAYAGGGEVKMESIVSGEDYSDVIAKSLQDSVAPQVDKTIQDLMKQLMLKPQEVQKEKSPGESPNEVAPGEELGNATEMVGGARLFMAAGFPPLAAAILAGNVQAESAWKGQRTPWVLNDGAGTNKGLISWNRSRITNAEKFLGKPLEKASNAEQVKWIKEELRQYGLLDEFMDPNRTEAQLKADSYKYIGWGKEGDRWKYSARIFAALQKGEKGSYVESPVSGAGLKGGSGKFIQGNSGASEGIHFHIGPGSQPGVVDTKYNADARAAASKVVAHFLGKKTLYDGRRRTNYTSASDTEMMAAQKAHSASGSQGGIDIQVGGAYDPGAKVPFPFAVSNMAYRPGGFGVSAKINGLNAFVAHGRYDEKGRLAKQEIGPNLYAFHGMNKVMSKDGLLKFHKGEYISVTDADSFRLVGNILTDINSIENKAQLVARTPSIIEKLKSISGYTDYEQPEPEVVFIPLPISDGGGVSGGAPKSSLTYSHSTIDTMGEQMSDNLMYG